MTSSAQIYTNITPIDKYIYTPAAKLWCAGKRTWAYLRESQWHTAGTALAVSLLAGGILVGRNEEKTWSSLSLHTLACLTLLIAHRDGILRQLPVSTLIQNPQSTAAKMQMLARKVLTLDSRYLAPGTFKEQAGLADRPVPRLVDTVPRFLSSVQPLMEEEDFASFSQDFQAFASSREAFLMQLGLEEFASDKRNWIKQLWVEWAYLASRQPLNMSSSWFGLDAQKPRQLPDGAYKGLIRATHVLTATQEYYQKIKEGTLAYEHPRLPICMEQYTRLFGSVRIPEEGMDRLESYPESTYMILYDRGQYFKFPLFEEGRPLDEATIFNRLVAMRKVEQKEELEKKSEVNLLTMLSRDEWAQARKELQEHPTNQATLEEIEKAMYILILDPHTPNTLNESGHDALCGTYGRWVDKMCLMIDYEGQLRALIEHTVSDATIQAAFLQYALRKEEKRFPLVEGAVVIPQIEKKEIESPAPTPLAWHLNECVEGKIQRAAVQHADDIKDIELDILNFTDYGKDYIKKVWLSPTEKGLSPDAWFQMALQLAYHRLCPEYPLTYESASTRLFWGGRTETIRTGSTASVAFVEAMDAEDLGEEEKMALLRAAIAVHVERKDEASLAQGVDRHLIGLKQVAAKMVEKGYLKEVPALFAHPIFKKRFALATSQTPFRNGAGNGKGGGFLPIIDGEGKIPKSAGVSYSMKSSCIYSHNTVFTSMMKKEGFQAEALSSEIAKALRDMKDLCDNYKKNTYG